MPFFSTVVGTLASGLGESSDPGGRDPPPTCVQLEEAKLAELGLLEESASDAGYDHP